ncbi:MAG: hypothetical protein ACOC56_02100 [Atribacterota bacterium]
MDMQNKLQYAMDCLVEEERTRNFIHKLSDSKFLANITPYKIKTLYNSSKILYEELEKLHEQAELDKVKIDTLDIDSLKKIYRERKLYKLYPNLDLNKLKELYENPPTSLKSPAYKKHIEFDKVVVRKYIIGIIQMIFNSMDLIVTFCGREGTGKTTASTQDAYLCYWILEQINIVDYEYTLNNIMYFNLKSLLDGFNKYSQNPFRIFILDEGNELNRKEWNNPIVNLFFQKLRRERKHLRILFINLPQLGELMPAVTLSRVNFVFQLNMKQDVENKLAKKGNCYFYILPRFDKIYSYLNKRYLYQDEVINEIGKILDDKKKYLQTLPMSLAVHKFQRNGVWSVRESEYDKKSKEANEKFSATGVTLSKLEISYLYKYLNLKKLEVKPGTSAYYTLAHLKNKKIGYAVQQDENIQTLAEVNDEEKQDKQNQAKQEQNL